MKNLSKQKTAFSLQEMSLLLLAVSLLLVAIPSTKNMVRKNKLVSAQALTKISPIHNVRGVTLWLETTEAGNFLESEAKDERRVSLWKDYNSQSTDKFNFYGASGNSAESSSIYYNTASGATNLNTFKPTYVREGINYLPVLRFNNNNGSAFEYMAADAKFKIASADSIMMVVVFRYNSGQGFLIDRVCRNSSGVAVSNCSSDVDSGLPLFGLQIDSSKNLLVHFKSNNGNFGSIAASSFDSGFDVEEGRAYVVILEREIGNSFNIYINGTKIISKSDSSGTNAGAPIEMAPIKFGRHFNNTSNENLNFDLAEFVLLNQEVSLADRQLMEDYLGKKFNIKIDH